MEGMLAKLLVPNRETVHEGRNKLKEALKNPEAVAALCDVIVTSSNPEIRQSATVLLQKQLGRCGQWNKLNVVIRNRIKQGMLQALVNEQEKSVKYAIAKFIGIIGRYEFPENSWPEVLQFIHTLCSSDTTVDKEMGLYSLSIMTEMSHSSQTVQAEFFAMLFTNVLGGNQPNSDSAYFTVKTMTNFAHIGDHQQMINVYHELLPRVIEIIMAFLSKDEEKACDLFEILEELKEFAIAVIVPHVKLIVDMCLQIASNSSISRKFKVKAIMFLSGIIRSKGKVVQKNKLVEPIIDVLIHLMAQPPNDEGNEEYFLWDPYQATSFKAASVTLNRIALHIPAEEVVPYLWTKVEPAIQGGDIYAQKAAYVSLAGLPEGCSKHIIRTKYLEPFLKCVCTAIPNPNTVVRNAALFALGKFALHLQPEISQYASELLPVAFDCLAQILQQMEVEKKVPPSLDRLLYPLERVCKNLKDGLMPYLPTLMERLFLALESYGFSIQSKCEALSALGAAATAVKKGILPYFQKIIGVLNYMISALDDQENQIKCSAIETLAVVAQSVGAENFKPLAVETLQLGLRILEHIKDPNVKKSVYALFAALAIVMKEELGPALPKIVNEMIDSIQDRIKIHVNLDDCDEEVWKEDSESSSSAGKDTTQWRMEHSYNNEKEQACLALRKICLNTGKEFLPFIEKSFEEIFKLVDYPEYTICRASVKALQQFCIALYKVNTPESKQALYKALQMFVPKCSELIRTDEERSVVMNCLDAYASLLDEIKGDVFVGEGHREAIMNCVVDVLTLKTLCQDTDFGAQTENNEDDAEAEQDELLLESAGDVIPKFAAAITPYDFACYFPTFLKLLSSRTVKQNSISQRSFAYRILAECMKPLEVYVEKFAPQLLKMWLTGARDAAQEVRKNSIFGLGEMILHGKDRIFRHHNEILQALTQAVAKETHAGTLYNICGALAKMNIVNTEYCMYAYIPFEVSNIKLGYTISILSIEFLIK